MKPTTKAVLWIRKALFVEPPFLEVLLKTRSHF